MGFFKFKRKTTNINRLESQARNFYSNGNYLQALNIYQKIEDLTAENIDLLLKQAGCFNKLGNSDEAIRLCNKVEKLDSSDTRTYLLKGLILIDTNRGSALENLERGMNLGCESCKNSYWSLIMEMVSK